MNPLIFNYHILSYIFLISRSKKKYATGEKDTKGNLIMVDTIDDNDTDGNSDD